ncbi:MAG: alkaline phosphatase, partial [Oceanococcaceae bacterium]
LIDQVVAFGARSFSVVDGDAVVYDSGDDFERITAHLATVAMTGLVFNASNTNNNAENRSDNKGPEPETVIVGEVDGVPYAFIGLERVGGIMVYDVRNPRLPRFVNYVNNRDFTRDPETETALSGDLGPEGLLFIPAAISPNGQDLLVVGNEVSGSTTIYGVEL